MRLPCRITAAPCRTPVRRTQRSYLAHTPGVPSINTADHAALRGTTRGVGTPSGFRDRRQSAQSRRYRSYARSRCRASGAPAPPHFPVVSRDTPISPYEHTSSGYPSRHQPFAVRLPVSEHSYCLKPCLAFGPVELSYSLTPLFRTPPGRSRPGCTRCRVADSLAPAHVERRRFVARPPNPVRGIRTTFDNLGPSRAPQRPREGFFSLAPVRANDRIGYKTGITLWTTAKGLVRPGSVGATRATLVARGSKGQFQRRLVRPSPLAELVRPRLLGGTAH